MEVNTEEKKLIEISIGKYTNQPRSYYRKIVKQYLKDPLVVTVVVVDKKKKRKVYKGIEAEFF